MTFKTCILIHNFMCRYCFKYFKIGYFIKSIIVIVTSKDKESDRLWGERQGAKAYLIKPTDEQTLVQTLAQLLAKP